MYDYSNWYNLSRTEKQKIISNIIDNLVVEKTIEDLEFKLNETDICDILKFSDIINFIGNKMFKKKDREKYMDVTTDLFENDLIEYKTYDSIIEDYEYSVKKDKNKDDFEIGI